MPIFVAPPVGSRGTPRKQTAVFWPQYVRGLKQEIGSHLHNPKNRALRLRTRFLDNTFDAQGLFPPMPTAPVVSCPLNGKLNRCIVRFQVARSCTAQDSNLWRAQYNPLPFRITQSAKDRQLAGLLSYCIYRSEQQKTEGFSLK